MQANLFEIEIKAWPLFYTHIEHTRETVKERKKLRLTTSSLKRDACRITSPHGFMIQAAFLQVLKIMKKKVLSS